ncbi:MAG TPA: helix-turn-helix domain-containing protein [Ideonella sp.]|uniref:helix-turn-helix domain-containing protein n=1 Tax=Ideonella sp. TaxID=1929293 RepID=UPI002E32788F|nr:helix-turn-helix domain-containing protein [Ideonella sp.]HEX5686614.1 helix-turn-helix domain-containing protein [Ideonella sp.]
MDYPLKLAEQLRPQLQALRKRRGMTQAQLGAAIGVTQARVVEIEANPGVVSLQQILQVLQALGANLVIRPSDVAVVTAEPPAAITKRRKSVVVNAPATHQKRGTW